MLKNVDLLPGAQPSVLGFGCAPILGSIGAPESLTAIERAWERGVNYFDVAPSYGYGEAEEFLGRFLVGKRDQAFIATKFGIEAHPAARLLSPLKSLYRGLRGSKKSDKAPAAPPTAVKGGSGGLTEKLLSRVPITAEAMERSLERSLRRLRTDHVDLLFIHEPLEEVKDFERVVALASKLKQQGKIRALGLAANYEDIVGMHRSVAAFCDVLQIGLPDDPAELSKLQEARGDAANVFFGVVKARSSFIQTGQSISEGLASLSEKFPRSVLLCSMFSTAHIDQNVKAFEVV